MARKEALVSIAVVAARGIAEDGSTNKAGESPPHAGVKSP